ncbi:sensor histidine kinase [Streptomyces sp. NBC_01012]|uniref:sensor histidine kinase n=1 Tax=Streptomyces sp. NBC_01012 TaxID=2903717 RepID=UPI0038660AF2
MSEEVTVSGRATALRKARARARNRMPGSPRPYTMLPMLLMGLGAFANLWQGETANPWVGGIGLFVFNSFYVSVVFRGFDRRTRESVTSYVLLAAMAFITFGLAIGYGGSWLLFFPLFALACGTILRGRRLGVGLLVLAASACAVTVWRGDHVAEPWTLGYGTLLSGGVTAAILTLSETVTELRATRQELARNAVERERLRFSRDLHDLLGHTLSVVVVKSEAARRLAPHDIDAAIAQVSDIESVGRQALTEIREAVTGYREGSLATELDRAGPVLAAAGIEASVHRSGPSPAPQTDALLGWVAREAVTNAVRHSCATRCEFVLDSTPERIRLTVKDNGIGAGAAGGGTRHPVGPASGTGLKGLAERLAAAGGSLKSGPGAKGGFVVTAELPAGLPTGAEGDTGEHDRA